VAPALQAMLEARSVAVVGASAQPGSFGAELLRQLRVGGFDGPIYPVNPRYAEIDGLACAASIREVPGPVDLVILGVGNPALEETLRTAAECGARSAVICASAHAIDGAAGPPLPERLQAIAREHAMAVCGGNGICSTCRVEVVVGEENLTPINPQEIAYDLGQCGRLGCQARILGNVGVRVLMVPKVEMD